MNKENMLYVLNNSDFMNWLMNKLGEHFYVDDTNVNLTGEDIFFARKLKTLYELVSEYAINNHIYPTKFMQYEMYYVYYNNDVFYVYHGNETYGCLNSNLNKKELPYCINFDSIKKNKMEELLYSNNGIFKKVKEEVLKLHQEGFKMDDIKNVLNNLCDRIDEEEKGFVYKKK